MGRPFGRGEVGLGTAAIGLTFHCRLADGPPRIVRAMRLQDPGQRGFAFTAAVGTRPASTGS
ncbi:conserved hypothetical protein [Streptomyces viridochromogenes DSM 40736]|uniref:Uncharacterized protein n=1 Tax=Streptomyces viridochromogenes (strain DSM 40736 / JCM 4977 / BCRC 1201 / Tue 494) TaxID=591159 RepID=D9X9L4_STRVT|nr:conserved hypothetical protein [Streptomyces viridochromogenes DSM 40736]